MTLDASDGYEWGRGEGNGEFTNCRDYETIDSLDLVRKRGLTGEPISGRRAFSPDEEETAHGYFGGLFNTSSVVSPDLDHRM